MRTLINKEELSELLKFGDLQNTIQGGSSPIYIKSKHTKEAYEFMVKIPGVSSQDINVDLVDRSLVIYNTIIKEGSDQDYQLVLPVNMKNIILPLDAELENIEALHNGEGKVKISIPRDGTRRGIRKKIDIKYKGY